MTDEIRVNVEYTTQLRAAAGQCSEQIMLSAPATVADLLRVCAGRKELAPLLVDKDGLMHTWLLICVNNRAIRDELWQLEDGDEIVLSSPISGG